LTALPPGEHRHCPPSPESPALDSLRMRRVREAYCAAVTLIDTHIGRILDELEESGLVDDTLILFMTDHGEMLGDRGYYQKVVPYDPSARIPLIAAGLDVPANTTVDCPVTTWDVSATILDAARIDPPGTPTLVGSSLLGPETKRVGRIVAYHQALGNNRYVAAVGEGHKLIHWFSGGEEELYDLVDDPREQKNIIGEEEVTGVEERLRNAAVSFERDHGVEANVSNDAFVDLPYKQPPEHYLSMYPHWSSFQFPPWMVGYSEDDLKLIAAEMRDCLRSEAAYICRDPEWRKHALQQWLDIGGAPAVYEALFKDADHAD